MKIPYSAAQLNNLHLNMRSCWKMVLGKPTEKGKGGFDGLEQGTLEKR